MSVKAPPRELPPRRVKPGAGSLAPVVFVAARPRAPATLVVAYAGYRGFASC